VNGRQDGGGFASQRRIARGLSGRPLDPAAGPLRGPVWLAWLI